ncbi:hypothetical protein D3C75_1291450 [compost metagenome]
MRVSVTLGLKFLHFFGKLFYILKFCYLLGKIISSMHNRIRHVLQCLEKDILFLYSHVVSPLL